MGMPVLLVAAACPYGRWEEVITHVPCGGNNVYPGGELLIEVEQREHDGFGGVVGRARPVSVWSGCMGISARGLMWFDVDDFDALSSQDKYPDILLHQMGHTIGIGYGP